jgi:hypothetical protein
MKGERRPYPKVYEPEHLELVELCRRGWPHSLQDRERTVGGIL